MGREIHHVTQQVRRVGPALLLVLLILAAYANSLHVPLLLDDLPTVLGNPSLRSPSSIAGMLFPPPEIYTAGRPLLNLSFALNYGIGGPAVGGYHLVNLAIHLAAAFTAFGVMRRIMASSAARGKTSPHATTVALALAAVWALHPLQTVSVTYISQRAESLMGLFYLLTLYGFLRRAESGAGHWSLLSIGACAAGMLTKEVMLTAPLLVFLLDWQLFGGTPRETWRRRWRFFLGLASTWLLLAALMLVSNLGRRAVGGGQGVTPFDYACIESLALMRYLRLVFWPTGLVFDYGPNLPVPPVGTVILCAAVIFGFLAAAAYGLYRKLPWALPLAAFFILLAPTSSFVPVAGQPIAENRLYLPLLAVIGAVAATFGRLAPPRAGPWLLNAIALAFALLSHGRNEAFASDVSIWTDTVAKRPHNQRAAVFLAQAHGAAGNTQASIEALLAAIARNPDSAELQNNVGAAYVSQQRPAEAQSHFEAALRLNPNLSAALENYGFMLYGAGQIAPALSLSRRAIALNPQSIGAHFIAGVCLMRMGDLAAAAAELEATLRLEPNHAGARTNLQLVRSAISAAKK